MNLNNLKIAWRNVLRSKLFTTLNIVGLALGFAGFILSYQYINRETSYDAWNPNYENIYLVGLTHQGQYTDQTPPSLANRIKSKLPEVEEAGRLHHTHIWGSMPLFGDEVAMVNMAKVADKGLARIMDVEPKDIDLDDPNFPDVHLIDQKTAHTLFPKEEEDIFRPRSLAMYGANNGIFETIHDIGKERRLSNIDYDLILIKDNIPEEQGDNPFLYQTYIQVNPQTDIEQLRVKINEIYQREVSQHQYIVSSAFAAGEVYLDPLKNLHLRPKHGSNAGHIMIWTLGILSITILVLAAVNFANLMVSQANKRAKEIGVKKIFGVSRGKLAAQFLMEVFLQCVLAALLAWWLVMLCQNSLQKWFGYDLEAFIANDTLFRQLIGATVITAVISGIYPAIFLSGLKPANILKGNFQTGHRMRWFRNGLLTFQFVIAILFITSILILSNQLDYIRKTDKGFEPAQVINLKNWGLYAPFEGIGDLRSRLKQHPEIEYVTATTDAPGNVMPPPAKSFTHIDAMREMDHIGVDLEYFEALTIPVVEGRTFTAEFARDTSHLAVVNESAVKAFGLQQPVGSKIKGCDVEFTIVGVVKDSKIHGFENHVRPTVYSTQNECGPARYKLAVMVKTHAGTTQRVLEILKQEWANNKSAEAIPFSYEFLDQKYAALHAKQEQLQSALSGFTVLSIAIAVMGLFSMSAYSISIRQKEMSIRKVLGASVGQLFVQLNKPFFWIFLLANLIALPLAYLLVGRWLATFAYRIAMQWWMFALAGIFAMLIALLTVAYQSFRAARTNPVDSLRDE